MNASINAGALLGAVIGLLAFPAAQAQAPMPPAGVCIQPCASGSDNPDGWPESGAVYIDRNYNTENAAADMPGAVPNPVFDLDWVSNVGRGASGAWKAWPRPGGEQNAGWPNRWGTAQPRQIFHSFTMHITRSMYNNVWLAPGATWMKFLDLSQVNAVTSNHRWLTSLAAVGHSGSNRVTGLQFGFNAGGAGTAIYDDGVNTNPDLTEFIFDEFVWFCIVFDEQDTSAHLYMTREGDAGVVKILFRDETTVFGSEFLGSTGRGWNPNSAVSFAGYWDFGSSGFSENATTQYMVIDDLVVADHWTGPPW